MGRDPYREGLGDVQITIFAASLACLLWLTQLMITPLGYPAGRSAQQHLDVFLIEVAATLASALVAVLLSRWWLRTTRKSHGEPPVAGAGVTANLPTRPPVLAARNAKPLPKGQEELHIISPSRIQT